MPSFKAVPTEKKIQIQIQIQIQISSMTISGLAANCIPGLIERPSMIISGLTANCIPELLPQSRTTDHPRRNGQ